MQCRSSGACPPRERGSPPSVSDARRLRTSYVRGGSGDTIQVASPDTGATTTDFICGSAGYLLADDERGSCGSLNAGLSKESA